MVKFCRECKRAMDDLDKFCRICGRNAQDSIDYHTFYKSFSVIDSKLRIGDIKTQEDDGVDIGMKGQEDDGICDGIGQDDDEGDHEGDVSMDVPREVVDKMNKLLPEESIKKVQNGGWKYLKDNSHKSEAALDSTGITLVPKEDVVRTGKRKDMFKMYDAGIHRFIPDILEKIEKSKDHKIRIRIADISRQMGEKFVNKKPETLYAGLRYVLFNHGIVVEMGSLKEIDPKTHDNVKVLTMRMKNPDDKLSFSMIRKKDKGE